eukprot:845229-Rhodomonas_salina.2
MGWEAIPRHEVHERRSFHLHVRTRSVSACTSALRVLYPWHTQARMLRVPRTPLQNRCAIPLGIAHKTHTRTGLESPTSNCPHCSTADPPPSQPLPISPSLSQALSVSPNPSLSPVSQSPHSLRRAALGCNTTPSTPCCPTRPPQVSAGLVLHGVKQVQCVD